MILSSALDGAELIVDLSVFVGVTGGDFVGHGVCVGEFVFVGLCDRGSFDV